MHPSVGRIHSSRIASTRNGGMFKRALSKLLNIPLSRFASLRYTFETSDLEDQTMLPHDAKPNSPGTSPDRPFIVILSEMIGGVAEPVISRITPHKVVYPEKPVGWLTARLIVTPSFYIQDGPSNYTLDVDGGRTPSLAKGQMVFVNPRSLEHRQRLGASHQVILCSGWIGCKYYR